MNDYIYNPDHTIIFMILDDDFMEYIVIPLYIKEEVRVEPDTYRYYTEVLYDRAIVENPVSFGSRNPGWKISWISCSLK